MKKLLRYLIYIILFILFFIIQLYLFVWIACEVPTSGITKLDGVYNVSYKGKILGRQFSIGFIVISFILVWLINKFTNKKLNNK